MGRKRLVMVVDDNVDVSQMVKLILEGTGHYNVSICNSGHEAYPAIRDLQPDLALLDIVMPSGDGNDIANKIWEDKSLARTKVVFMTSLISKKEASQHPVIGGHPFISKPINAEDFLRRVNGFFEAGTFHFREF